MPRILPAAVLLLPLVFAVACIGDDKDDQTTTPAVQATEATSTPGTTADGPTATAVASQTPAPAATPVPIVDSVGPVEPLGLLATTRDPLEPELFVYNVGVGSFVFQESPAYYQAWYEVNSLITTYDDGKVRFLDIAAGGFRQLDLAGKATANVVSDDGAMYAISTTGSTLYLIELPGKLTQRKVATRATPVSFSPDGTYLLVRRPDEAGLLRYAVMPVADPAATALVPPGESPNAIGLNAPQWLDEDHVMLLLQNTNLLQVYDVSGTTPQIVLEETVASDEVVASPDGALVAVGQRGQGQGPDEVVVYRFDPFMEVARIEDATLGQYLEVSPGVWSPDDSRLLILRQSCTDDERLVSYSVDGGPEVVLANGLPPIYRFGFSPDGGWVAFTTHPTQAHVVPADGSAPALQVDDNVAAPGQPAWTADSVLVAFPRYVGGYDICLGP
jgi:hypothetical protein